MKGRIFAGFGAALFLVTSSALAIAVILTVSSSNNSSTPQVQTPSPTTSSASNCPSGFDAKVGSVMQGYTAPKTKLTQLETSDIQQGTGPKINTGATINVCYVGALANTGVIFDDSGAHGGVAMNLSLNNVISGWSIGIPGMKVGGIRELLIPADLAYGSAGSSGIPANSNLVFVVDVLSAN